jgi:lipopolysaccharide export system protein LptA
LGDTPGDSRREGKKEEQKKPQSGEGPTEITAQEASFDQKGQQAVFAGQVVVKNPEFNITCDKLTAFLRNGGTKEKANGLSTGAVKPAANQSATPVKPAKGEGAGGLEKVIADGSVIITQEKIDTEGNVNRSVGRARRAVYDSSTGDVILTGRPELQQGINACVATDDNTIITLNREGRMKVSGPSKTVIRDRPENPTASNGR